MNRIVGIDSMRIVCALIVMLGHFGTDLLNAFSLFRLHQLPHLLEQVINTAFRGLFNGPAAVIVFFIISGFCIHYPNRHKPNLAVASFYLRRLIRIGLPAFVALILWYRVGLRPQSPTFGVFWSIICESIYYLLYPLLFKLRMNEKTNWAYQLMVAYGLAFGFALLHLPVLALNHEYPAFGPQFMWVVGLPCWLLGCWLAENYARYPSLSRRTIWLIRGGIFGLSCAILLLRYHVNSPLVSYIFTLNLFAFVACVWVGLEIVYFQHHQPSMLLEWGGKWSYSLYLIHEAVPSFIVLWGLRSVSDLSINILSIVASLLISYLFYQLIEYPSHKLALLLSGSKKRVAS